MEFDILKGRNLVPMDTSGEYCIVATQVICTSQFSPYTGLSNPYIEVKYGMEIVYRTKVMKHTLNPDWLEHVSLSMPSVDEVITVVTTLLL